MNALFRNLALLLALLVIVPSVSAFGYGTSSISFTQSSVSLSPGGSGSVGYNVTIATGSTWGTSLNVVNGAALKSAGINVTLSNPGGDNTNPPFNGTLTVSVASTVAAGVYHITLNATGDDPSTSNAELGLVVTLPGSSSTTSVAGGQSTTVAVTTQPTTSTKVSAPTTPGFTLPDAFLGLIVLVIILMVIAMAVKTMMPSRQIIFSVALIFIGVLIWLYGDYTGGALRYIWSGVALIVVGTLIWIWVDHQAHLV